MKILLVAATRLEVEPFLSQAKPLEDFENTFHYSKGSHEIYLLISGVGSISTTYQLTHFLSRLEIHLVFHLGIAGSYSKELALGDCVRVDENIFADLGLNKSGAFHSLFDLNLLDKNDTPYYIGKLLNHTLINNKTLNNLKAVKSNTVNFLTDNLQEVSRRSLLAEIETMEGGAIAYVCLMEKIPFVEVRSISNYVGDTNKKNWNIPLAVNNSCKIVEQALEEIVD